MLPTVPLNPVIMWLMACRIKALAPAIPLLLHSKIPINIRYLFILQILMWKVPIELIKPMLILPVKLQAEQAWVHSKGFYKEKRNLLSPIMNVDLWLLKKEVCLNQAYPDMLLIGLRWKNTKRKQNPANSPLH